MNANEVQWLSPSGRVARGAREALVALRDAGCRTAYIDGSFVTAKEEPGDFDVCWEATGVDASLLDPVLLEFDDGRRAQQERFGGELFWPICLPSRPELVSWSTFSATGTRTGQRASSKSTSRFSRD